MTQINKLVSTKQTQANIFKVTELLVDTPHKLMLLSARLSSAQLRQPLAPDERSFTETLVHLLNCEARSTEAIILALLEKEPLIAKIHPERQLGKLIQFEQLPTPDLLAYFKLRRTVLLNVLNSLTEPQWARTIREEGKKRRESVYWQARGLALHEAEHLSDIEGKLEKKVGFE